MEFIELDTELLQTITAQQAWHYSIIPKSNGQELSFYIAEKSFDPGIRDELELLFGTRVSLEKCRDQMIRNTLSRYYHKKDENKRGNSLKKVKHYDSENFLDRLLEEAQSIGSSDIHIESYEQRCRIRFRIDGKLVERYTINKQEYPAMINKIKIKSNLDIAEKRLPQDGRMSFTDGDNKVDIRVSVLPSLHGEKAVLRLLSRQSTNIELSSLGFTQMQMKDYLEGIKKLTGIVLISGPTGSGKTTTLYATLKILNSIETNILTIEDPIEYTLEGINQVQLKESIGLSFASALRTFLRQDPDIIMLGEIRDHETAQMAIRAALTGHLVLSTIHTNSAWGTISRLLDMGIPGYLLSDTLNLSVAQRLIRLLCPSCKQKVKISEVKVNGSIKVPDDIDFVYQPAGCEKCHQTGFKGRSALYEVIPIHGKIADEIRIGQGNPDQSQLEQIDSMQSIAWKMLKEGKTSYQEIYPILLNNKNQ